jgi:hypothetical protein
MHFLLWAKGAVQNQITFSLNYLSAKYKRASGFLMAKLRDGEPRNCGSILAIDKIFTFLGSVLSSSEAHPSARA